MSDTGQEIRNVPIFVFHVTVGKWVVKTKTLILNCQYDLLCIIGYKNNESVFTDMSCCYCFFPHRFQSDECNNSAFDFLPRAPAPLSFSLTLSHFLAKAVFYFTSIQGLFNKSWDPLKQNCSAEKFQLSRVTQSLKFSNGISGYERPN